jgi:pyruvate/2-oxoglutarate dehydrogenase complex dihydrolipoamide acyltransferase (E2) component
VSSSPTSSVAVEVTMPQMGVSVAEGTIVEWKKAVGDQVQADEPIVEISTDKVETEIPAPASGQVVEILVEPGQTVDVGVVLARIEVAGQGSPVTEPEPEAPAAAPPSNGHSVRNGAPPISPVVRRMADEHGIDLSQVEGSGRLGRVTKRDVLAFLHDRDEGVEAPTPAPAQATLHIESPYVEEPAAAPVTADRSPVTPGAQPLSHMRRQIGEHMVRSLHTAAHCTTIVEADMSAIEAARGRLSYLPFVARATIAALREYPMLNATLEGDQFTMYDEVHLGIAVSLGENGLIVPVVHNAHELSHEGLAARIKDLAERARSKRLKPEEVAGGTFTITNPGAFGALLATPIINQPQVAILDLEAVVRRPVVVNGDSIAIRPMTYLCMSWDHRALDGALAAQFLSSVRRHLEEWSG